MMKMGKKILSLLAVMAIMMSVVTLNHNEVKAATGVGYVNVEATSITERGQDVYVTYEFSVDEDNGPLGACYVIFTWDSSVMTFNSADSIRDNMVFANEKAGEIHAYLDSGMRNEKCGVTLKFTNVLENTTATEALVQFRFKDATSGTVEFGGADMVSLTMDQIEVNGTGDIQLIDFAMDENAIVVVNNGSYTIDLLLNGQAMTADQLKEVEWSVENVGGCPADADIVKVASNGALTTNKSGVARVKATYMKATVYVDIVVSGDVDRNGIVNGFDATRVQRCNASGSLSSLGIVDDYSKYLADMNEDGIVNGFDATKIQRMMTKN